MRSVAFSIRLNNSAEISNDTKAFSVEPGSEEDFITEHYWGYAAQRDGSSVEYRVEHPQWRVWAASEATLSPGVGGF